MTTPQISTDVMALIAATRNAAAHAEHVGTFGKAQAARKAVFEYHQAIQVMLQAYPEGEVKKAREEVMNGRNLYNMEQVDVWILTHQIAAKMLGMTV